jgi:hypothetical protein
MVAGVAEPIPIGIQLMRPDLADKTVVVLDHVDGFLLETTANPQHEGADNQVAADASNTIFKMEFVAMVDIYLANAICEV